MACPAVLFGVNAVAHFGVMSRFRFPRHEFQQIKRTAGKGRGTVDIGTLAVRAVPPHNFPDSLTQDVYPCLCNGVLSGSCPPFQEKGRKLFQKQIDVILGTHDFFQNKGVHQSGSKDHHLVVEALHAVGPTVEDFVL